MGVWQMIESDQPYVGQWDAVTDSFWDGLGWVSAPRYTAGPTVYYGASTGLPSVVVDNKWPIDARNFLGMRPEKEVLKAQDPWEALKSMF